MGKNNKNNAFTLAETLIALVVIGVVAAMTIPLLMNYYNKNLMGFALKKSFSVMNQCLLGIAAQNDVNSDIDNSGFFNSTDTFLGDNFVKYLKVAKNCGVGSGCFSSDIGANYNSQSKVAAADIIGNHYSFITTDNMAYMLQSTGSGCSSSFDGASSRLYTKQMTEICGKLWVDVNGFKGPNNYGRDIFLFYITNGITPSLYPAGGRDDAKKQWSTDGVNVIGCDSNDTSGYACAGRVIGEGWEVNY